MYDPFGNQIWPLPNPKEFNWIPYQILQNSRGNRLEIYHHPSETNEIPYQILRTSIEFLATSLKVLLAMH